MTYLRPTVLPDEFVSSYEGRVLRYNGWADRNQALQTMLALSNHAGAPRQQMSTVELLAGFAGTETAEFVRGHTMLPLRRAVTRLTPGLPHGSHDRSGVLRTMPMRAMRPGAYFCLHCVEEDLDFHGTPYWRREQQLPGVFWCSKHGVPLRYVEQKSAFSLSPSLFVEHATSVSERWVESLKECAPVQTFHGICADLMARMRSLDEELVSRAIRARALEMDLHVGRRDVKPRLLSDLIKRRFDKKWLDSIVPGLTGIATGEYCQTVDGALRRSRAGASSVVYALAFATLFESVDDAVNAMVAPPAPEALQGAAAQRKKRVSDMEYRFAYIASDGNHSAAATRLSVERNDAKRRLERLGLPTLRGLSAKQMSAVMSAVLTGTTCISEACRANDVPLAAALATLRRAWTPLQESMAAMTQKRVRRTYGPKPRPVSPPRESDFKDAAGAPQRATRSHETSHRSASTA